MLKINGDGSVPLLDIQALSPSNRSFDGEVGNTAVGALAGDAVTTGIKNVFVGKGSGGATTEWLMKL